MTCLRRVALEAVEDRLPLAVRDLAVILQRAERRQRLGQHFQRLDPLREDDRLAAALGHLRHVGQQLLQLGALRRSRGSKLQICFSRITSSKTCCTVMVSPSALRWTTPSFSARS